MKIYGLQISFLLVCYFITGACSEHSILEWSKRGCEWTTISQGFVCDRHHNFTCFDVPSFVPCLRISFIIVQPKRDHVPVRVSCTINGSNMEVCPLDVYPLNKPCNVSFTYQPDRIMDHTLECVATSIENTITCIGYSTANVGFCHDPYVAPKNKPAVPVSNQFYFPVDYEDPTIQEHIKAHPMDFAKYTPHNHHPKIGILSHTAHNFRPHFTTHARKEHKGPQTQAFTGGRNEQHDYEANHHDEIIHTPAYQWETWPTDGAFVDVHTDNEKASVTHTHRLRPWQSSTLPEPHLPGLQYITSYNEDVHPELKLKPDKSGYYKDFTSTDDFNANHDAYKDNHPSFYNTLASKDAEMEQTRVMRQVSSLKRLYGNS